MNRFFTLICILMGLTCVPTVTAAQNGACAQGVCTLAGAEAIAKSLGLDWSFELDGCDDRARTVALGLQEMGMLAGVLRVNESVSVVSRFIPWQPELSWGHHTAAYVVIGGQRLVLDYALFDRPVTIEQWQRKLTGTFERELALEIMEVGGDEWLDSDFAALSEAKAWPARTSFLKMPAPEREVSLSIDGLWDHIFFQQHISDRGTFYGEDFSLRSVYRSKRLAQDALLESTRCVQKRDASTSACTTYLRVERQTCYFKFAISGAGTLNIEGSNEMFCF